MQTIKQLAENLGLDAAKTAILENYLGTLVVELLENLKQDNLQNFDDTIKSLSTPAGPSK